MINSLLLVSLILHAGCLDPSNLSLEQRQQCAVDSYQKLDAELDAVYAAIRGNLNQEQGDKLRKAQLAWLAFREADCANQVAESSDDSTVAHNLCLAKITQQRIRGLQGIYSHLFIGYTPVDYAAYLGDNETNLPDHILLGSWRNRAAEYDLQFKIVHHERLFVFTRNGQDFKSGYWQFIDGQLMLSDENGNILHLYNQVLLEQDNLILYEKEGNIKKYQRLTN